MKVHGSRHMHSPTDTLFDAPVGVVHLSLDGAVLRANPAFCSLAGVDSGTLVGTLLADTLSGDGQLPGGAVVAPSPGERAIETQHRSLLRPDGSQREVDCTSWIVAGAEGEPSHVCMLVRPVSDREPIARRLGDTLAALDRVFETTAVGIVVLDERLCVRRVNPALATMFRLAAADLVGRSYFELLGPGQEADVRARLAALESGEWTAPQVERRFVDAEGRVRVCSGSGARVRIGGENLYYCLYVDVTARHAADGERAQLQEQVLHAERLRTLGQLASGIAHEVNNPAAIAMGAVELARKHLVALSAAVRTGDLETVRRQADRIDASLRYCEAGSARLGKVARKLAAFAGLQGGEVDVTDVNTLVQRALDLVENDLRHRAELVVDLQELPPLHVHPGRLVLALTNLLLNAAQAVNGLPAAHRVTVTTRADANTIVIGVADTGIGLPPGVLDHIFEPFFTTLGPTEGTGLGLAVVNDVVRQHRGRIEVRSEPGSGTAFLLHLPLANGLAPPAAPPARPTTRGRVLVVDDEPLLLEVLADLLAPLHEVVTAGGGEEAIALLAQDTAFDAVLCDLMMPGVDGAAVHTYLHEHAPTLAARTVFITGGAFTARAAAYMDALGRRVLIKPFTADEATEMVRLAMAGEA